MASDSLVDNEIKKELKQIRKALRSRLTQPTTQWVHPPDFVETGPDIKGGNLVASVYTEDGPYFWLDRGTAVRYATMHRGFKAKTKVRSFSSSAGVGGVAYVSRKTARDGIEAREWTELAALEYSAILQSAIDRALARVDAKNKGLIGDAKGFGRYEP